MRISDWSSDVCSSDLVADGWHAIGCGPLGVCNAALRRSCNRADHFCAGGHGSQCARSGVEWSRRNDGEGWSYSRRNVYDRPLFSATRLFPGCAHKKRSEEHTSELQSLMRISYAVFCLKKKTTNNNTTTHNILQINNTRKL